MIEKWVQITCDGCGETSCGEGSNETANEKRQEMKQYGWVSFGRLDYCRQCVQVGHAKRRATGFGTQEFEGVA